MSYKNKCIICEKEFTAKVPHTNTCSIKCRKEKQRHLSYNFYLKNKENGIEKKCEVCGIIFTSERQSARFCSMKCVGKGKTHPTKKSKLRTKCLFCGNDMKNKRWFANYCSISCSNKHNKPSASPNARSIISRKQTLRWLNGKYDGIEFHTYYKRGLHFSPKLNKNIHFRSLMEKEVFEMLDKNADILTYISEPLSIEYFYLNEDYKRNYIPDLLITYKNGIQKLIEIKPNYLLENDKNKCKFQAAQQYCENKNLIFEVWTEKELKGIFTE